MPICMSISMSCLHAYAHVRAHAILIYAHKPYTFPCPHIHTRAHAHAHRRDGTPTDANARTHAPHAQITTCPCTCRRPRLSRTPVCTTSARMSTAHVCVRGRRTGADPNLGVPCSKKRERLWWAACCRRRPPAAEGPSRGRRCTPLRRCADRLKPRTRPQRCERTSMPPSRACSGPGTGTTERAIARSAPPPDTAAPARNDGKFLLRASQSAVGDTPRIF